VQASGGTKMSETKPYQIEKQLVLDAWLKVKANRGSGGVDKMTIGEFDKNYRNSGLLVSQPLPIELLKR